MGVPTPTPSPQEGLNKYHLRNSILVTNRRKKGQTIIKKPLLLFIISLFILTGCNNGSGQLAPTPEATYTIVATKTSAPSKTPAPQNTPTLDPPTEVPTKQPTPTITPTPTQIQPVHMGTVFPQPSVPITKDNASELREIANYGNLYVLPKVTADGQYLFIASGMGIDIYDYEAMELVKHLDINIKSNFETTDLCITPDGKFMMAVSDTDIKIVNFDGDILLTLPPAKSATLSPDGELVVISNEDGFKIINVENQEEVYAWDGDTFTLHGDLPVFSQDGSILVTWFGKRLWVWQTSNWQEVQNFWLENPNSNQISWKLSPHGERLAISNADVIEVMRISDGTRLARIDGFNSKELIPNQMIYSPDGKTLAVLEPGIRITTYASYDGHKLSPQQGTNLQSAELVQITDNGRFTVFELPEGQVSAWSGYRIPTSFRFLKEEAGIQFTNNIVQSRYDISGITEGCILHTDHQPSCLRDSTLVMDDNERFYIANTWKNNVVIYDVDTAGNQEQLTDYKVGKKYSRLFLVGLARSQNSIFYILWNDIFNEGTTYWLDYEKRTTIKQWDGFVRRIVFSDDNKFAAFFVQYDATVDLIVLDLSEQKTIYYNSFDWCTRECTILDFSYDNKTLVYSAGHGADDSTDWYPLTMLSMGETITSTSIEYTHMPLAVAVSPGDDIIAVALGGGTIAFLDIANGEVVKSWRAYENQEVSSLEFSADGSILASNSNNSNIKIWGILP